MFVLFGFILLAVVGVAFMWFSSEDIWCELGTLCLIVGLLIVLLLGTLGIPVTRNGDYELIASYNIMRTMLSDARTSNAIDTVERAAIMTKVFDINEKLDYSQRKNQTQWDWWHVDEIMQLEPLK